MISSIEKKVFSFYTSKKVLISGASGYIGSNLINKLSKINCQISCVTSNSDLQKFITTQHKTEAAEISVFCGPYRDRTLWEESVHGVDVVFHLASQTSFYEAESDPVEDYMSNVFPMQLLLEQASKEKKKPFVVLAGTSTQCGIKNKVPIGEEEPDNPSTIYDLHKLIAENYLKYYCSKKKIEGCCLRLCNVYGPGPKSSKDDRGILNLMLKKALIGDAISIYGTGDYIRDYIFIDDVVNAFLIAPLNKEKTNGKHFILGSGKGFSLNEAISKIVEVVNKKTKIQVSTRHVASPDNLLEIEFRNFVADNSSLKKATGWSADVDLEKGIELTIDNFIRQKSNE